MDMMDDHILDDIAVSMDEVPDKVLDELLDEERMGGEGGVFRVKPPPVGENMTAALSTLAEQLDEERMGGEGGVIREKPSPVGKNMTAALPTLADQLDEERMGGEGGVIREKQQPKNNKKSEKSKDRFQDPTASKYRAGWMLTSFQICFLVCLFLSTDDYIAPVSYGVLKSWFQMAADPARRTPHMVGMKSVVLNTDNGSGYHWIRCVFRLPNAALKVTGMISLFDDLSTTACSKHVKVALGALAATQLTATGTQEDSWSCGYFALLWMCLALMTGVAFDKVRIS
jgi:hypothetical protein